MSVALTAPDELQRGTVLVAEATEAGKAEGARYFAEEMGGRDMDACGFAWVDLRNVDEPMRSALLAAGFGEVQRGLRTVLRCYFRHEAPTQGLCCLTAANLAAAAVFTRAGFSATVGACLD